VQSFRARTSPEIVMNSIRTVGRLAGVLASLAGAVLAFGAMSPAAFADRTPPFGGLIERGNPPPAVRTVVIGGMPGWQIALIAVVTAILVSMLAVILDRARAADGFWPRRVDDADI
jgi:hypothetical protein